MLKMSHQFIGNEQLIEKLDTSYKKKTLSNSLIFSGPKGIGKKTLAFFFIKNIFYFLSNKNLINHHINLIYNNTHPNIKYLRKDFDKKTNKIKTSISIEQIRNLENFFYQSSLYNLPKFILIDSADDLNKNSANALLKILEEPKDNTFFILITHQLSNLLPTLRSRCVKFYIKKPNFNQFNQILNFKDKINNQDDVLFLYNLCNGSPGAALKFISENFNQLFLLIIKILDINKPISKEVIQLTNLVINYSNDQYKTFLLLIRFILMTIIKINIGINLKKEYYSKFYESIENIATKHENSNILKILEFLNNNENDLFLYNLDKKVFSLNIFTSLNN